MSGNSGGLLSDTKQGMWYLLPSRKDQTTDLFSPASPGQCPGIAINEGLSQWLIQREFDREKQCFVLRYTGLNGGSFLLCLWSGLLGHIKWLGT